MLSDEGQPVPKRVQYSEDFQRLIGPNQENIPKLLDGSCISDGALEDWEKERKFITQAINRDGTILDIGCANGFLLRSLQEWSDKNLIPYGIDTYPDRLKLARKMFPEQSSNFQVTSWRDLIKATPEQLQQVGFPTQFDMIYWNVWDNFDLDTEEGRLILGRLPEMVVDGGRVILGFYNHDKAESVKRAEELKILAEKLGFNVTGVMENPNGSQVMTWIDKSLPNGS